MKIQFLTPHFIISHLLWKYYLFFENFLKIFLSTKNLRQSKKYEMQIAGLLTQ